MQLYPTDRGERIITCMVYHCLLFSPQCHFEVPTVIVCGDQSTGKSSVVQRICGINLPRSDLTCTRCPMEVMATHDNPTYIGVLKSLTVFWVSVSGQSCRFNSWNRRKLVFMLGSGVQVRCYNWHSIDAAICNAFDFIKHQVVQDCWLESRGNWWLPHAKHEHTLKTIQRASLKSTHDPNPRSCSVKM